MRCRNDEANRWEEKRPSLNRVTLKIRKRSVLPGQLRTSVSGVRHRFHLYFTNYELFEVGTMPLLFITASPRVTNALAVGDCQQIGVE